MKRKLEFIVLATGILSLVYVNLFALRANRLVSSGLFSLKRTRSTDTRMRDWESSV